MKGQGVPPLRGNLKAFLEVLRLFRVPRFALAELAVVSLVSGLLDALVIALVVEAAAALAAHRHVVEVHHLGSYGIDAVLGLALVVAVLAGVLGLWGAYLPVKLGAQAAAGFRNKTLAAYLGAEWALQVGIRQGGFVDLVTQQTEQAGAFIVAFGFTLSFLLVFAGMALTAAAISPLAFLGVIFIGVVLFLVMRPVVRLGQHRASMFSSTSQQFAAHIDTVVGLAEEIRVFGAEAHAKDQAVGFIEQIRRQRITMGVTISGMNSSYQDIATMGLIGILFFLAGVPNLNLASLGAVVLILIRAMSSGQGVQNYYSQMRQQYPFVQRVRDVLEKLEVGQTSPGNTPLVHVESLELRDVSFGYVAARPVLREASAVVCRGELIAVVGASGAGKSTLLQILLRLRAPDTGHYLINGVAASSYDLATWSQRVAYVPQDSRVLHASVADNIRFFRDIPMEDVVAAAEAAQIAADISALPQGYETFIGQRVDAFSGGQRQRLCLARALAGRPQLLILDEPTSALDDASEMMVHQVLAGLRGRVTTIVVAHRPGILKVCDRVLRVSEGRIHPGSAVTRPEPGTEVVA